MSDLVMLLAQAHGGGEKTLWDPTILGVLVALSAVGLFCGSVYLLLSTNLGARLGFLVSAACLSGFMVLLSLLWITTATPLTSPKGNLAKWEVIEVVDDPELSTVDTVRTIRENGERVTITEEEDGLAALKPGVEAGIVQGDHAEGEEPEPVPGLEQRFQVSTDFLADFEGFESYTIGGESRWLFWHEPQYAVVQICTRLVDPVDPGRTPRDPACDPLEPTKFVVMEYDYGTVRQPPWIYFGVSLLLFGLSLLGLHWYEKDQREQKKAATPKPVPVPAT